MCGQRLRTRSSWRGKCCAQTNLLTLHSGARELAGKRGGHCTCELLQKSFDRLTAIICDRSLCTMSEAPGASVSHDSLPRCFRPAGGWLRRAPDRSAPDRSAPERSGRAPVRSSSRSGSGSGPSAAAPSSGAPPRSTKPPNPGTRDAGRDTRARGHTGRRRTSTDRQTPDLTSSHVPAPPRARRSGPERRNSSGGQALALDWQEQVCFLGEEAVKCS